MSDEPYRKILGNDKFYKLSKNLKAINFIPSKTKPNNKTYVSHAIFEGDVDFGDEKIEWLGEKPESFPENKVSIVELIQTDSDKIYAHVFGQAGASKDDVNSLGNRVSILENFVSYEVYQTKTSLPTEGNSKIIYLVKKNDGSGNDYYDEYIWTKKEGEINAHYELIGNTSVNLSNYVTLTDFSSFQSDFNKHVNNKEKHIVYDNDLSRFLIGPRDSRCELYLNGSTSINGPLRIGNLFKFAGVSSNFVSTYNDGNYNFISLIERDGNSTFKINASTFIVGPLKIDKTSNKIYINDEEFIPSSEISDAFSIRRNGGKISTIETIGTEFIAGPLTVNKGRGGVISLTGSVFIKGPLYVDGPLFDNDKLFQYVPVVKKTTWNTYSTGDRVGDAWFSSITGTVIVDGYNITFTYSNDPINSWYNDNTGFSSCYGTVTASTAISKDDLYPALLRKFLEVAKEQNIAPVYITIID